MWSLRLIRAGDPAEAVIEERPLSPGRMTFGRGADVDWVLADTSRVISKRHCHIICQNDGTLQLVDTSSNGVYVSGSARSGNDRAPSGSAMDLATGDRVRLGDYVLLVTAAGFGSASSSGWSTPLAPVPGPGGRPSQGYDPFGAPANAPSPFGRSAFDDPFAGADIAGVAKDPFAVDPSRRSSFERAGWGPEPVRAAQSDDGWQDAPVAPPRRPQGPMADAFERPLMAERPTEATAFEIPTGWNAWTKDPPAAPPAPPAPRTGAPAPIAAPFAAVAPVAAPRPLPEHLMEEELAVAPPVRHPAPAAAPPAGAPVAARPVAAPAPAAAGGDASYAAGLKAGEAAAMAYFVSGAGLDPAKFKGADVEAVLANAGQAYAQAILGIAEVLRDRAFTKNQFRIQQTIVGTGNNNPLKFLPPMDAAVALLRPIIPGLMGPQDALNAACADVKKHQLAVMAGLRAALRAVFDGLKPAGIEARAKKNTGSLGGLTESGRQARAWTEYVAYFKDFEEDANDSADSLVNREFRRGYEEHFARLDQVDPQAAKKQGEGR